MVLYFGNMPQLKELISDKDKEALDDFFNVWRIKNQNHKLDQPTSRLQKVKKHWNKWKKNTNQPTGLQNS